MHLFRLTLEESDLLRSQSVTLDRARGQHRKYLPYAFTEQGVTMLSTVLRSRRGAASTSTSAAPREATARRIRGRPTAAG